MFFWEKECACKMAAHGYGHWKWSYLWIYEMALPAIMSNEIRGKCEIGKVWLLKIVGGKEKGTEKLWNKSVWGKGKRAQV